MSFETSAIRRGETSLEATFSSVVARDDGSVSILRGGVDESLRNTAAGLEQSWTFDRMPAGSGDLEIRVSVEGGDLVRTNAASLQLTDASGGSLRIGDAQWVDATGARSPVTLAWCDHEIVLSVPSSVVDSSEFPAVLDPLVSPEIELDKPMPTFAPFNALSPSVGFDGTNYLVVWVDERRNLPDSRFTVFGARVSPSKVVLDPAGFEIGQSFVRPFGSSIPGPVVAFNGSNYLVAWEDHRNDGGTYNSGGGDIYGARVSTAGVVLDPAGVAISKDAAFERDVAIASDGTDWLVAWIAGFDIRLAHVGANGAIVSTTSPPPANHTSRTTPGLAFNGTNYLLAWTGYNNDISPHPDAEKGTMAIRFTPSAVALDAAPFVVTTLPSFAPMALASNHVDYVVASLDAAIRVSGAGTVLDSAPIEVSPGGKPVGAIAASYDGANYVFAWADQRSGNSTSDGPLASVYAARMSAGGTLLDASGVLIDNQGFSALDQVTPAVAGGSGSSLVVYGQRNFSTSSIVPTIYGGRISGAGVSLDSNAAMHISTAANTEDGVAVAAGPSMYLAVWVDQESPGADLTTALRGVRVADDGALLDATPLELTKGPSGTIVSPAVAFDGTNFVVAWRSASASAGYAFSGTRVSPAGVVLDLAGFGIAAINGTNGFGTSFALASGPGMTALVFEDEEVANNDVDLNVYAIRIDSNGKPLDAPGIRLTGAVGDQASPAVAFDGTDFVAVWRDPRASATTPSIYGARFGTDGILLDTSGIPIANGLAAPTPSVGCTKAECLVTWLDGASIAGVRLTGSTVVDATPLALGSGDGGKPAVAWNGTAYNVIWEQGGTAVRGVTLASDGGLASAMDITTDAPFSAFTGIAANDAGESLVAYSRLVLAPPYGAFRARARFIGGGPWDGGADDAGGDDASTAPDAAADGGAVQVGNAGAPSAAADESCGCRLVGAPSPSTTNAPLLGVPLVLALLRRRRRERSIAPDT